MPRKDIFQAIMEANIWINYIKNYTDVSDFLYLNKFLYSLYNIF